jgi:hypothetical protein
MRRRQKRVLPFVILLTGLVLLAVSTAGADRAKVLGKTNHNPDPLCPGTLAEPCVAVGSVTGIQVKAEGKTGLFKMPVDGRIVGWSVDLSKPNRKERKFFGDTFGNDNFGKDPVARIGVLKKVSAKRFKLTAQSPAVNLQSYLGQKPVITITHPLRAGEGKFVALTVPTWLPSLVTAGEGTHDSQWRASRPSGKCGSGAAKRARPQQQIGSTREYGCRFTDRLLYWAYYVPR